LSKSNIKKIAQFFKRAKLSRSVSLIQALAEHRKFSGMLTHERQLRLCKDAIENSPGHKQLMSTSIHTKSKSKETDFIKKDSRSVLRLVCCFQSQ